MKARVVALVALAAAVLVILVGTASAFGTVRDLFLGPTAGSRIAFTSFRNAPRSGRPTVAAPTAARDATNATATTGSTS